jgi:hypothetical protein
MSDYSDILDAAKSPDRPVPDGWTEEYDCTLWNRCKVFRWSDVYSAWLDCEVWVSVRPFEPIAQAFERRMDHPMWLDYAVFFPCEE